MAQEVSQIEYDRIQNKRSQYAERISERLRDLGSVDLGLYAVVTEERIHTYNVRKNETSFGNPWIAEPLGEIEYTHSNLETEVNKLFNDKNLKGVADTTPRTYHAISQLGTFDEETMDSKKGQERPHKLTVYSTRNSIHFLVI